MKSEFTGRITLALAEVCATARFQIWKFNRIKDPAPPPPPPWPPPTTTLTPATAFDTAGSLTRPAANCIRRTRVSVSATPLCCGPVGSVPFDFSPNVRHLKKKKKPLTPHRNSWCYSTDPGVTPPPWNFQSGSWIVVSGAPSRRRAQSRPGDTSPRITCHTEGHLWCYFEADQLWLSANV